MARVYLDVSNHTDAVFILKTHCRSAQWDQKYRLWSVEEDEIKPNPELLTLKRYNPEQLQKLTDELAQIDNGLSRTYSDLRDQANIIYLDRVLASDTAFLADPSNGFRFSPVYHTYYCSREIAFLNEHNKKLIYRNVNRHKFSALDFGPSVSTRGKEMLASALNITDESLRLMNIAEALIECAREKAEGVEGSVSYAQIIKVCDSYKIDLGLKNVYSNSFNNFAQSIIYNLNSMHYRFNNMFSNNDLDAERKNQEIYYKQKAYAFNAVSDQIGDKVNTQIYMLSNLIEESRLSPHKTISETINYQNEVSKKRGFLSQDEYISRIGLIFEDFVKSVAIHSNVIALGGRTTYNWDMKIENFNNSMLHLVKSISNCKNLSAEDKANLINQTNIMTKSTVKSVKNLMRKNLEVMEKNKNLPLSLKDYAQFEVNNLSQASDLTEQFKKLGYNFVKNVITPFKQDKLRISSDLNVIYLVMSDDERRNLSDDLRKELRTDLFHGALCVEDTPLNREKFCQFMPSEEHLKHMSENALKNKEEILFHLKNAGVDISKISDDKFKEFLDGQVHEVDGISFKYNIFSNEPTLQVGRNSYKIDLKNGEDFERFIKDSLKVSESNRAFAMEKRQRIGNKISSVFRNDFMLNVSKTNLDFPFCKRMNVSVEEIGGFIDQKGAFDKVSFVKEGTKTNTTLYLPMFTDTGKIVNTLAINDFGKQELVKDAPLNGAFGIPPQRNYKGDLQDNIPDLLSKAKAIMICTDPLSAVAVAKHAPDGVVVVSAMTSSNIKNVALNLAEKYPHAGIGVFGDTSILQAGQPKGKNVSAILSHEIKNVLHHNKPLTKVYDPPVDFANILNEKKTLYEVSQSNPNTCREYIVNACIETISNQELQEEVFNSENKILKKNENIENHVETAVNNLYGNKEESKEIESPVKSAEKEKIIEKKDKSSILVNEQEYSYSR